MEAQVFLTDKEICSMLMDYVQKDKTKQAILIDGDWGSGKSYFIRNVFITSYVKLQQRKNLYYVSLYGMTDVGQIESTIYGKMLETCIANKASDSELVTKTVKLFQRAVPMALQKIGINDDGELKKIVKDLKPITDVVIVFDDLERCNIEINQILGYINNLVEHNEVKAIIIANEQEIWRSSFAFNIAEKYKTALMHLQLVNELVDESNKKPDFTNVSTIKEYAEKIFRLDNGYVKVKEKLIGRTIKYCKQLSTCYDSVLDSVVDDADTKKILQNNSNIILYWFNERRCNNLRSLIAVFTDFQKINQLVQRTQIDNSAFAENVKKTMLEYLTYCVLKVKSGEQLEPWDEIETFARHLSVYVGDASKFIYGYRFVHDLVSNGYVDYENFNEEFKNYVKSTGIDAEYQNFINQESAWKELVNWRLLEDEEVKEFLQKLKKELKENKYKISDFGQIFMILVDISQNDFKVEFDDYLTPISDFINGINNEEYISTAGFYAYGKNNVANEKYRKVIRPVIELVEKKNSSNQVVKHAFLNTAAWDAEYVMKCQENQNYFINIGKFFAYYDVEAFQEKMNNASASELAFLTSAIKQVYNFSNLRDCFKEDAKILKELLKITQKTLKETKKITLRLNLNDLCSLLHDYLRRLGEEPWLSGMQ